MKVLVVDDSKAIRQLVAECLRELRHQVDFAENGAEALQYVADQDVDLVLMDVEMPRLNGFEATQAIRELRKSDWFPIVFLTTRTDDDSFCQGILAGGDAYLQKPLNPLRLRYTMVAMERIYLMRQKLQKSQQQLQLANQELEWLSQSDQLTGLANRRRLDSVLALQFALAQRNNSVLSVLVCDIDYFKKYNDSYGHVRGDECLVEVAKALSDQLRRSTDLICRYGGEEFVAVLPATLLVEARELAERMRHAIQALGIAHASSECGRVTLSIGAAAHLGQYSSPDELIKAADAALYRAKQLGRNRVEIG